MPSCDISSASSVSYCTTSGVGLMCDVQKRRRISVNDGSLSFRKNEDWFPTLCSTDYFMEPCLNDLVRRERMDPGYSRRVPNFTVGRIGYGYVRFMGQTDVRWLDLDQIVKFHRHEVVVYEDENAKPVIGEGLNKAAEVTLTINVGHLPLLKGKVDGIVKKLRQSAERQGANFVSFDPSNCEWKFLVQHFSRFGLSDDEEEVLMDDATGAQALVLIDEDEISDFADASPMDLSGTQLSHSLPTHLGLDPASMNEMRMLMFSGEEGVEDFDQTASHQRPSSTKRIVRPAVQTHTERVNRMSSPPVIRKTPLALLEYNIGSPDTNSPDNILMAQQNKGLSVKKVKPEGFQLDLTLETPITGSHSSNIVDAALFMGRSFRAGWGPNGMLFHTGSPIGSNDSQRVLSSVIHVEKVAIDKVVRDENNKVNKELVDFTFDAPLSLHKALNHERKEIEVGKYKLKLHKVLSNRYLLTEICRSYIDIIEEQLEIPVLSSSARLVLMHQVMVWELIKVLFSDRESAGNSKFVDSDSEEDMMQDLKEENLEVDLEALPLIRRAEFSRWLQESVCHRVQEDVSSLNESCYLDHLFFLLTGRQLDAAVELAISNGDVRHACLLSQAGGSMVNRTDIALQLDLWKMNGLDFNFIEKDRIRLYELLAGNIHGSLQDVKIDWKRFLGLLMWYHLPPNMSLPVLFQNYQQLLEDGKAPFPLPIYVDEGPAEDISIWGKIKHFDISYYLMLLHGSEEREFGFLKTMFSAFSSTHDPLDYHMIWHQREVLEAVGAFSSNDLQVLDMGFVSQLLCQGHCHWAIYVVLHMPQHENYPYLQAKVIWEILFQYCECWSSEDSQRQFIEELGVPSAWMHEALAVYFSYHGELSKALEHYLDCGNWQKAHSIFVTSVAHTLFLAANHSEVWRIATSIEDNKSEIENWDLGAGIYIAFYLLKSSFQEDSNTMAELDSLESKNDACKSFVGLLNESLAVWDARLPFDARVVYTKMAEEVCDLLLSDISQGPNREAQLSCFDTVFTAPLPEDLRSRHLQDAVSLYTVYLGETVA